MANLYELTTELKTVESLMEQDSEAGLSVDECLIKALDEIKGALSTKVCNIGAWIKNLESEAEAIKAEQDRLALRRSMKDALAGRLKTWVLRNIEAGAKFEDARCQVGTRKSSRVEVDNFSDLPSEFVRSNVIQEAAKDEIKKVLAKGGTVKGARLVENISLSIK